MDTYTKQKKWADRRKKLHLEEHLRKEAEETQGLTFKPKLNTSKRRFKNVKSRLLAGTGLENQRETFDRSYFSTGGDATPVLGTRSDTKGRVQASHNSYSRQSPFRQRPDTTNRSSTFSEQQQENDSNPKNENNKTRSNTNIPPYSEMLEQDDSNSSAQAETSVPETGSFLDEGAVHSHIARQQKARRLKESMSSGNAFKVKKAALSAKPFKLSRSNLPFASKPLRAKAMMSEQHLVDKIRSQEREIELLKLKHSKEIAVKVKEALINNEIALKTQAEDLLGKHREERSNWHVERAKLLQLIDTLRDEIQHREDVKSNADNLSKVVLSTFEDLSKHMLTIEKHSIEEQRLIRAKLKDIPKNSSNVDSAKSKIADIDAVRSILRSSEKNIRRLILGREESSTNQVKHLESCINEVQRSLCSAIKDEHKTTININSLKFQRLEENLTGSMVSSRKSHNALMQQLRDMDGKLLLKTSGAISGIPNKTMTTGDGKNLSDSKEETDLANNTTYDVGEVHEGDEANRDEKDVGNATDAQMDDEFNNQMTQETRSDDVKFDAANNNDNEVDEPRAVHLTNSISRVDCSMESLEKEETNNGVNEVSFDLSEDGSQQSKYDDSNASDVTTSSLDSWIEVVQGNEKGGTFWYNRHTREVRKQKPELLDEED